MAADHTLAWAYVEDAFAEEDDVIAQARYEAGEYGIASLSAATCAFLRQLARIAGAKSAVEVGPERESPGCTSCRFRGCR